MIKKNILIILGIVTSIILLSTFSSAKLDFSNPFFPKLTKDQATSILFSQIIGTDYNGCSVGNFVTNVSFVNGNLIIICDAPAGAGDITSVLAGTGLFGGGTSGDVTLNVSASTCSVGQVSKYNGTGFVCVTDSLGSGDNASWNQSFANTLYANIQWNYNQSSPFYTWLSTFLYNYNQTIPAITDINNRFWNRTQSYNKTEIDSFNTSWSTTYNSTYNNILNQQCPVGKVVNGTLANGTFICTTDTGGTETDPIFSSNLSNGFSNNLVPLVNNTQNLGNLTRYWNTTFQYRFCLGGINCWKQIPFYYDDENNPTTIYTTEGINMLGKPFVVSNIEAEDSSGIHLNDTVVITDQWNVTGNYFFGKFPFTNFTGTDDNACTGTDKVSNVTFKDGALSITCTTDVTGSGGDGTGSWINDTIQTNTSVNVNVRFGANVSSNWFNGLFNWTTLNNWLNFDGATLSFNETKLNQTISSEGVRIGFNSTYNATYDAKVSFDKTNVAYLNETQTFTRNNTIKAILNISNSAGTSSTIFYNNGSGLIIQ